MKLTTRGNSLLKDGKDFKLIGVNIGDPLNTDSETGRDFYEQLDLIFNNFTNLNAIRMAIIPAEYKRIPRAYDVKIKKIAEELAKKDMYLIVDYHPYRDPWFFIANDCKDFWKNQMENIADLDNVIYEIYNEPIYRRTNLWREPNESDLLEFHQDIAIPVTKYIRSKSDNLIIIGSHNWCGSLDGVAKYSLNKEFTNIAYSCHLYPKHLPSIESREPNIKAAAEVVPIIFTETGFEPDSCEPGTEEDQNILMSHIIDKYGSGYIPWCCSYNESYDPCMWRNGKLTAQGEFFKTEFAMENITVPVEDKDSVEKLTIKVAELNKLVYNQERDITRMKKELLEKTQFIIDTQTQTQKLVLRYGI